MEVSPSEVKIVIDYWELRLAMLLPTLGSLTSVSAVVSGRACFGAFVCDINYTETKAHSTVSNSLGDCSNHYFITHFNNLSKEI